MATPEDGERAYTIDELATAAQLPSRTIRFYQSKGVLPRPELKGRVAYYGAAHLARLQLIASLQDRGLRIDAIRGLVARLDKGEVDLGAWLGLDAQLQTAWAPDAPRTMTEAELRELTGERTGMIAALQRAGLVERRGAAYLAPSPALLQITLKLDAVGVGPEISSGATGILRKHLARATTEVAKLFFTHAEEGFGHDAGPRDVAAFFQALRALGPEAVRLIFAQEMERELRELSESGKTTTLTARGKRPKPA
jgi:DNA-binding transcriptional MerR regulator